MNQYSPLITCSTFSVLIPLLAGILSWRKLEFPAKCLTLLLVLAAFNEVLVWMFNAAKINSNPLIHGWITVEYLLLSLAYGLFLQKQKWLFASFLLFMTTGILMEIFVAGPAHYPYLWRNIESLFIIGLALIWFFKSLTGIAQPGLGRSPAFWIAASHLIYFAGTLVLFNMVGYIRARDRAVLIQAWNFHAALLILLYTGYTIALLCRKNPPQALSRSSGSAA